MIYYYHILNNDNNNNNNNNIAIKFNDEEIYRISLNAINI